LRDLLDFARPGAPSADDEEPCASVREAVEHVVALVKPQRSLSGVEVVVDVAADLPAVAMHAQRIEQVLLNLLLNAADAVPASGGRIALAARSREGGVVVTLEDNGGGIEPSVRECLFEPFVTTKEVGKGTGLGLAVCRGLVESAGGTIDAEEGDEGARFVLVLPRA
jgi:C4-dicarboxylate-specific signal transduction histidine kinase